ncbi:hypothetical protein [Kitasatospora sp. NPDC057198]|uniref:hypothetical protein n=1 Tax=Kitasatospora sp. NPDC057198 TaxID=3346046 RepID=UPI00362ACDB6
MPEARVPEPRSVPETVWRALLVLVTALAVIPAGAWVTSKFLDTDGKYAMVPGLVAGGAVLVLGISTLRCKIWYIGVPGIATVAATFAGGLALSSHLVSDGRLHLENLGLRLLAGSLALTLPVAVLGVLVAAVAGHRHPWEPPPKDEAGPVPPTAR